MLNTARLILAIICGSYLLSAALLGVARPRGQPVPIAVIATWAVLGLIGFALLPAMQPRRWLVLIAIFIVLFPWMAYSFYRDSISARWIIAVVDLLGLAAIGYSFWIVLA